MEPKATFKQTVDSFDTRASGDGSDGRSSLFESLKRSKFVYDSQITKMSQENVSLQNDLELCQDKLFEVTSMFNTPNKSFEELNDLKAEIESMLRQMGCDDSKFQPEDLRTSMVLQKASELKLIENRKQSIISQGDTKLDSSTFMKDIKELLDPLVDQYSPSQVIEIDIAKGEHCQFVSRCKDFSLPKFRGLYVCYTHDPKVRHDYDKTFMLVNKRKEQKFKIFKLGIMSLMHHCTQHVYLNLFTLDNNSLKFILENWHRVQKLTLRAWEIRINRSFSVKLSVNYLIEEINLFGTCDQKDHSYLNEAKLNIFASALASTKLRTSLGLIRVWESAYPSTKVQDIFDKYRFSLEVVGEENCAQSIE